MGLDVSDLRGIGFGVDDDVGAVEVKPHQPGDGLAGLRHRRQPAVVIGCELVGNLLRQFDCHNLECSLGK